MRCENSKKFERAHGQVAVKSNLLPTCPFQLILAVAFKRQHPDISPSPTLTCAISIFFALFFFQTDPLIINSNKPKGREGSEDK